MKIRVLGAGFYGCVVALDLIERGHDVEVHELTNEIFAGASGNNPARLHIGPHYPRSGVTRHACQTHSVEFMERFGDFTRAISTNVYAVAQDDSLVDFRDFTKSLRNEIEFITVARPKEFGLQNVEGAILCGERHIILDDVKAHFAKALAGKITFGVKTSNLDDQRWDYTIDATFSSYDGTSVDRFEPCMTVLLSGPTHKAVTVMDGRYGSLYPWNADKRLCSLTHAELTPFAKNLKTWREAKAMLDGLGFYAVKQRALQMIDRMAEHYPAVRDYRVEDYRFSVRAIQRSGCDSRLVDIAHVGARALRVRAGKISGVFPAARAIALEIEKRVSQRRSVPARPSVQRKPNAGAAVWANAMSMARL